MSQENEQVPETQGFKERFTNPFVLLGLLWIVLAVSFLAPFILEFGVGFVIYPGEVLLGNPWLSLPLFGMMLVGAAIFVWSILADSTWGVPIGIPAALVPFGFWYFLYSFTLAIL